MEIKIKNYQAIKSAKLEIEPGLTVIVGDTNNGKSALFRAIETAIYNKPGTDYIRFGERIAAVQIRTEDASLVWRKDTSTEYKTMYSLNGDVIKKPGRGPVDEVMSSLGMSEVRLLASKERLNFWKQMKYPFLLDKTPSQLFEFLSLSGEEKNLSEILKEMRTDLKETTAQINRAEGGVDSLKESLRDEEAYLKSKEGFDPVYDTILALGKDVKSVDTLSCIIEDLEYNNAKINAETTVVDTIITTLRSVEPCYDHSHTLFNEINVLSRGILSIKALADRANKEKGNLYKIQSSLSQIDIDSLANQIHTHKHKQDQMNVLSGLIEVLDDIGGRIETEESTQDSIQKDLIEADEALSSFDVCPLCGQSLEDHDPKESHS